MDWTVRAAKQEDIKSISPRLRDSDKTEILLSSGKTPEETMMDAWGLPKAGMWVGCYKGIPEVIFGVQLTGCHNVGIPWMACTDVVKQHPKGFMRLCKKWSEGFSSMFDVLINFVWAENHDHIRWIEWCGFDLIELHPEFGSHKQPFWEFRMERK